MSATTKSSFRRHTHPVYAWVLWTGLTIVILSALRRIIGRLVGGVAVWCGEVLAWEIHRGVTGAALAGIVPASPPSPCS